MLSVQPLTSSLLQQQFRHAVFRSSGLFWRETTAAAGSSGKWHHSVSPSASAALHGFTFRGTSAHVIRTPGTQTCRQDEGGCPAVIPRKHYCVRFPEMGSNVNPPYSCSPTCCFDWLTNPISRNFNLLSEISNYIYTMSIPGTCF